MVSRHKELQKEVCDLTEAEEQLDQLISKCSLQLRLLTEDPQNKKYPFDVTNRSPSIRKAIIVTVLIRKWLIYPPAARDADVNRF